MTGTRRQFLAGLATTGLAATGGCLGLLDGDGDGDDGPSPLERWTPSASEASRDGPAATVFSFQSYDALLAEREALAEPVATRIAGARDGAATRYGLTPESVTETVAGRGLSVYLGSFGATTTVEELASGSTYQRDGEYEGYRLFRSRSEFVAVGDGVVVEGRRGDETREFVRSVVDAGESESDRRAAGDETFAALATLARGRDTAVVAQFDRPAERTSPRAGLVAGGVGFALGATVDADSAAATARYAFDTADDVDTAAVESVLSELQNLDPYEFDAPSVDGRVVSATGTAPVDSFDGFRQGPPGQTGAEPSVPQASFDFEYDPDTDPSLTITHTGGDNFNAENTGELRVVVDGETQTGWPLPVSAGSTVQVDVASRETVRLVWAAPDGDQTRVVASFTVP